MKIYFDVKNQIITRTDRNQVIANSADYLEAEITFSAEWATMEKTMTFKNGNLLYTYVLVNDKILEENHLNLGVGTWKVSIQGVNEDKKIVTNECNLAVNASGWIGSEALPPESIWNQLLVIIQSLHTEVASTAAIRSAVQKYIEDNYDALVKEAVIVDDVRAALDDMAEDGTLSDLLAPLVAAGMPEVVADQISAVVATQIGGVVANQIGAVVASQITTPVNQAVKNYCDDNFSGWSGALDRGLAQPLMAAPADMVGAINSALTYIYTTPTLTYDSGTINAQGNKETNNKRIILVDGNMVQMRYGDYVDFGDTFEGKFIYYNAPIVTQSFFVAADADFGSIVKLPKNRDGLFVSLLIRLKADPTADISSYVSSMNDYVTMYIHTSAIDDLDKLEVTNKYYGIKYNMDFISGTIGADGSINAQNTRIIGFTHKQIKHGDVFNCDTRYKYKYAIYDADTYTSEHFVAAPLTGLDWASGEMEINPIYEGKYIAILYQKVGSESSDIRSELGIIANHTDYCNLNVAFNSRPLEGKKLSLLGGSMSAYTGYIPEGNGAYYTGSNAGVSNPNQMWWWQMCAKTGMTPLIIDAWSGSGITQFTGDHADRVPMSDDSRCKDLDDNGTNPDVILLIGGTNDWTYASSNANLPLEWDGKTTPVLTNSFSEALAVTIKKIQDTYPNAILVVCSTVFCIRPTWDGYASTHVVNGVTYTLEDYDKAIENVCKIMRVPYLKVNDIGFNPNNYYPTYCVDSSTSPTHPNAAGHAKIGQFMADRLTEIVGSWFK